MPLYGMTQVFTVVSHLYLPIVDENGALQGGVSSIPSEKNKLCVALLQGKLKTFPIISPNMS